MIKNSHDYVTEKLGFFSSRDSFYPRNVKKAQNQFSTNPSRKWGHNLKRIVVQFSFTA